MEDSICSSSVVVIAIRGLEIVCNLPHPLWDVQGGKKLMVLILLPCFPSSAPELWLVNCIYLFMVLYFLVLSSYFIHLWSTTFFVDAKRSQVQYLFTVIHQIGSEHQKNAAFYMFGVNHVPPCDYGFWFLVANAYIISYVVKIRILDDDWRVHSITVFNLCCRDQLFVFRVYLLQEKMLLSLKSFHF